MRIKFAAAVSLFAISMATTAFAQPLYSDDYTNDSDGFAPSKTAPAPVVHYKTTHKAPEYSSDYTNDSDGFSSTHLATAPVVDGNATASMNARADCQSMVPSKSAMHTQGGDSGASRTDAYHATH